MKIILSFLLALTAHAQVLDQKNNCPTTSEDAEVFIVNGTCYELVGMTGMKASWENANNDCKSRRGTLLIFTDKSNEGVVVEQIIQKNSFDSNKYWLGITKKGNSWKWTTGETVSFTPSWVPGTGDCAVIELANRNWSPIDCNPPESEWSIGYVCQYGSSGSSSITQDAVLLLAVVLMIYKIFVNDS